MPARRQQGRRHQTANSCTYDDDLLLQRNPPCVDLYTASVHLCRQMEMQSPRPAASQRRPWKVRWVSWRNRILAADGFRAWAARVPFARSIARSRARQVFDLVAGFSYSQLVLAAVESGVLETLAQGPQSLADIRRSAQLSDEAADRLIRAMAALDLAEEVAPGLWMLGQHGAVIQADRGVQAMVRHHRLLYADLADPLALLRGDRGRDTALSRFWTYARAVSGPAQPATAYSELMAASQAMVAREVRGAYDFGRHEAVLDIGGGHGAFVTALAAKHPGLRLGIFDLPEVVGEAQARVQAGRYALHAGDFFRDSLPQDYDCVTLIRILHDHDDARALTLLTAIRRALPPKGRLVLAEPMDGTRGAPAMGAYFSLYLWAMGSGRPRRADEIGSLLRRAGFARWHPVATGQPIITSLLVGIV